MKQGVSKNFLLITAGIIWIIAGINILRIGVITWLENPHAELFKIAEATVIFLLFFIFIFRKLYNKYTQRIEKKEDKNCPFSFFDIKGWIMMTIMMSGGFVIRTFNLLPNTFISVFYSGLSLALIFTGLLFVRYWWQKRRL